MPPAVAAEIEFRRRQLCTVSRRRLNKHVGGPDPLETSAIKKVRDTYILDLHIDTLNVKARSFR